MDIYARLAEVDPTHFHLVEGSLHHQIGSPGLDYWDACSDWDAAGWCLEQMQAARKWRHEPTDKERAAQSAIASFFKGSVDDLTPEKILTAYADMCEARGKG